MEVPTDPVVSRRMASQRTSDTRPELDLRRELYSRGLRYRVQVAVLKGVRRRHDIVFVGPKVVVDVHGCFWHGCPEHFVVPKTNTEFWQTKIGANRTRDLDTTRRLRDAGWVHVIVWECADADAAADEIASIVRERSVSVTHR